MYFGVLDSHGTFFSVAAVVIASNNKKLAENDLLYDLHHAKEQKSLMNKNFKVSKLML